ncbi:MAG: DUF433 domain-containing protein [Gemmataceae bacterium]|nr:DUF433 domain-containing protein [Gemmataceae bacterium]
MPRHQKKILGRYIVANPKICHGKPTFIGTRIMVRQILRQVAKGKSWDAIVKSWGGRVTKEGIAEAMTLAERVFSDYFKKQAATSPSASIS